MQDGADAATTDLYHAAGRGVAVPFAITRTARAQLVAEWETQHGTLLSCRCALGPLDTGYGPYCLWFAARGVVGALRPQGTRSGVRFGTSGYALAAGHLK